MAACFGIGCARFASAFNSNSDSVSRWSCSLFGALALASLIGCAISPTAQTSKFSKSQTSHDVKTLSPQADHLARATKPARLSTTELDSLRKRLRLANEKVSELQTQNWVLKKKVDLLKQESALAAKSGVAVAEPTLRPDEKLDLTRAMSQPRTADELLAKAVMGHANMGNLDEAERTLELLKRSYPDAELTRETQEAYVVHLIEAGFNERAAQFTPLQNSKVKR